MRIWSAALRPAQSRCFSLGRAQRSFALCGLAPWRAAPALGRRSNRTGPPGVCRRNLRKALSGFASLKTLVPFAACERLKNLCMPGRYPRPCRWVIHLQPVERTTERGACTLGLDTENQAGLGRVTCGWKLPHLSLEFVRPYWRDAHSPTIARREGVYEYRHYPLDPPRAGLFDPLGGIEFAAPEGGQLQWLSDVRYRDEAALQAFGRSPLPDVRAQILADIDMIVDQSTTYLVVGDNGVTLKDASGTAAPQGPSTRPNFAIFIRQRGEEAPFRALVRSMAERWAQTDGVVRVRLNLFEVPDMEAERAAGYPVKTHPQALQYQAWIDLIVEDEGVLKNLISANDGVEYAACITAVHAYTAPAVYTFNYNGAPTLSGLRGYPACEAIGNLGAAHQKDPALLEWLYGPIAKGGVSG